MRKLLRKLLRFFNGLLDRVVAVCGVVGLAQFPQFFGQYIQRLGGHLAEAQFMLVRFELMAEYFNMTLEEYIKTHLNSGNEVFASSGQLINELLIRIQTLEETLTALRNATVYNRWWVFIREFDYEIVRETWVDFTPGLPTTLEGLVYSVCGLFVAWGVFQGIKSLLKGITKIIKTIFIRPRDYRVPL